MNIGTPLPRPTLLPLVPGRSTGMKDMHGKQIMDGDTVLARGVYEKPTRFQVRLVRWPYMNRESWAFTYDGTEVICTGCPDRVTEDNEFGVEICLT